MVTLGYLAVFTRSYFEDGVAGGGVDGYRLFTLEIDVFYFTMLTLSVLVINSG